MADFYAKIRIFAADLRPKCPFPRHIAQLSLSNHHLGKENEQKSKNAEVAHRSADFSIAFLGLVVSLRENMAELRYFCVSEISDHALKLK
ncbi:MAG: hypothetical protein J6W75_04765 [Bacteroidaceae bacterium]|nr:hypothetical protein [Bacteroidaceae bacterium]